MENPVNNNMTAAEDELIGRLESAILEELKNNDENDFENEMAENNEFEERLNRIGQLFDRIPDAVKKLEAEFEQSLDREKPALESGGIPEELKDKLSSRQESLDLCLKILKRLKRVFPQFIEIQEKLKRIPCIKKKIWDDETIPSGIKKQEFAQKEIQVKKDIEEIRNNNYHVLRRKKELYYEQRYFFNEFFQRYFFPVIDGLDNGRRFFAENQPGWLGKYPEQSGLIKKRFEIYEHLILESENFLKDFFIVQIPAGTGDEFDEQIHVPFMVEPDEKLQNNHIKEVSRKGYKFAGFYDEEAFIIRPAQVIVVKNDGDADAKL